MEDGMVRCTGPYVRVVGYYRALPSCNDGKIAEFQDRSLTPLLPILGVNDDCGDPRVD